MRISANVIALAVPRLLLLTISYYYICKKKRIRKREKNFSFKCIRWLNSKCSVCNLQYNKSTSFFFLSPSCEPHLKSISMLWAPYYMHSFSFVIIIQAFRCRKAFSNCSVTCDLWLSSLITIHCVNLSMCKPIGEESHPHVLYIVQITITVNSRIFECYRH